RHYPESDPLQFEEQLRLGAAGGTGPEPPGMTVEEWVSLDPPPLRARINLKGNGEILDRQPEKAIRTPRREDDTSEERHGRRFHRVVDLIVHRNLFSSDRDDDRASPVYDTCVLLSIRHQFGVVHGSHPNAPNVHRHNLWRQSDTN